MAEPPLEPKKRATQRCPNCELKLDVSLYVDGSLARCGRCGVRFTVSRDDSKPPPAPALPQRRQPPAQRLGEQQQPAAEQKPLPIIEGFLVHERLGQGGMGEVFNCTR